MSREFYTDIAFVYYDYPWDYDRNTPLEEEDFDTHRVSFSGDTTADALLRGLDSLGYVDREKYLQTYEDSENDMEVNAILDNVSLLNQGVNGDEKDFIVYIEDDMGQYIFDDEQNAEKWKAQFMNKF